uniref:Uncharacterized protein n=1 Tax=Seriola dumerili TaxID=41447 RepID=A0A3B4TGN2_SERDU
MVKIFILAILPAVPHPRSCRELFGEVRKVSECDIVEKLRFCTHETSCLNRGGHSKLHHTAAWLAQSMNVEMSKGRPQQSHGDNSELITIIGRPIHGRCHDAIRKLDNTSLQGEPWAVSISCLLSVDTSLDSVLVPVLLSSILYQIFST